jgi:hypothetical protein
LREAALRGVRGEARTIATEDLKLLQAHGRERLRALLETLLRPALPEVEILVKDHRQGLD